ncbi:carboxypeptidase-like regulatory domain-containing protein [Flavobacterium sp. KACC 22758]|uniref:TonB-dependent receptor domain-containing protein n=1 Tax=Flavobacterium sp. KACC 22758 TaxID=3025667 RepID=UPI0023650A13|nr:TonB-dependent receptor [Flavobacterium sp. KACC 22758]WDF59573.1 carboxypeptidase-like regulatory domain-containing protein [Flavobacterium sp. KACC 22758]
MRVYLLIMLFFSGISFAQNTITGSVTDGNKQSIPGANVVVLGSTSGVSTDFDGSFKLTTNEKLPFTLKVSAVGFESKTISITSANQKVNVILKDEETKLDEIVVSASRTPERVIESPVTIERMGLQEIKNTTAATFYDGLENLKEVNFNTSSISFKSVNTRGFATVANTRFMQLVDGMDNSSPALNFVLGNLIGVSDIDVASVELLPGASSALYGANAFNGIMFMTSKSPFTNEGISVYYKYGQTSQDAAGTNDYNDFGIRAAKAFTKHFAMKANFTYMEASEWIANDTRSMTGGSVGHAMNQNYDGLNIYGDEVTTFIPNVGQVSRTGYREQDLTDNKVQSMKADFSAHIKPWADDTEFILQYKIGTGSTIYQGANRYALKDFLMQQGKFEVKGKNFFGRIYFTSEDAGNSYDMRFAAWNVNRTAKSDTEWFTNYATAYQYAGAVMGTNANESAAIARNFADYNVLPTQISFIPKPTGSPRFEPGSPQFNSALKTVVANPDLTQGAKFIDHSKLYHSDVNYNFKDIIDWAEIQVGGSWRKYVMDSQGTIFTDYDGPIEYKEYGAYAQLQKKFLDDRLKFTGSLRYDKSQNFDGNVSPRISFVYSAGANKNHNFRLSYQTGFRNPTTQDQYIGLDLGPFALIGSAPENLDRFQETVNVSAAGQAAGQPATIGMSGQNAYHNAYTVASVQAFAASSNSANLQVADIGLVKPEQVQAFEAGYRTVVQNDLSVDLNAYYNIYNDFMNTARVISPYYGTVGTDPSNPAVQQTYQALAFGDRRVYQVYTNTTAQISSFGFGVGLSKKVYKDFEVGANYNYSQFNFNQEDDPDFVAGFNTPKHRIKASLGNAKVIKNLGFNINVRWNSEYLWESSFGDGMIPENTVLDAQINYAVPKLKSVIKVGATNLFGKDYLQVIGAGMIGQMWFASWTINP